MNRSFEMRIDPSASRIIWAVFEAAASSEELCQPRQPQNWWVKNKSAEREKWVARP